MTDLIDYDDFLTSHGDAYDPEYEPELTAEEMQEREIRVAKRLDEMEVRF